MSPITSFSHPLVCLVILAFSPGLASAQTEQELKSPADAREWLVSLNMGALGAPAGLLAVEVEGRIAKLLTARILVSLTSYPVEA